MRRVVFGAPPMSMFSTLEGKYIVGAFRELEAASYEDNTSEIADAFTLGTFTETFTLDPATATATDVANVLATLLKKMQARGVKKG
jgi:hypothetical protein